jgi:hypothetical protein
LRGSERSSGPGEQPDRDRHGTRAQRILHDPSVRGAEREPHAELRHSRADSVCHDAGHADAAEHEREQAEEREHARKEAVACE